jgi:hypothetical protein
MTILIEQRKETLQALEDYKAHSVPQGPKGTRELE